MSEQFIPELDCYPSDLLPEDIIDARDIDPDDEGLDMCDFGEHEFEVVLIEGGLYEIYECIHCGAIDTE